MHLARIVFMWNFANQTQGVATHARLTQDVLKTFLKCTCLISVEAST